MMLTDRDSRFCISLWTERKFRGWDTRTKVSGSFVNFMECLCWILGMPTVIAFNLKHSKKKHCDWSSIQTFSIPFDAPDYWTAFISCYNNLFTFDSGGCAFFLITCEASQQMMTDEPQERWHIHHNFCVYFLAGSPASDNSGSIIFPKFAVTNVKWEMIAIGISADLMNGGLRLRKLIWKWNIWYVSLTGKQPSWASLCFPIFSR